MKYILIPILMFYVSIAYADIDADIDTIKHANAKEKFKLMNAFKKSLLHMKENERIEAIKKISQTSHSKHAQALLHEFEEKRKTQRMKNYIEQQQLSHDSVNENIDLSERAEQ